MSLHFDTLLGIAAAALTAALGTIGYLRSRMVPRFRYMADLLPDAAYRNMAATPGWRAQSLSVATGVDLRGLVREPASLAGPWVLFFAGNSACVLREGQQMLEALCAGRGWGGMVWAYRGFDSSDGTPNPRALADDGFKAWLHLLTTQKIRPDAVHLVGFSLGTSIAAAVAARAFQEPPASVTLLAPMTALYVGERTQLRLHRYETSAWLAGIASPVLVIHGTRDTALPIENGRAVAKALGSRATLLELPETGHSELPLSPVTLDAMRVFMTRHAAQ